MMPQASSAATIAALLLLLAVMGLLTFVQN